MPKGTKILTGVPEAKLAEIVKMFESEGASVSTAKENGTYTVTAVFPDSAAETEPVKTKPKTDGGKRDEGNTKKKKNGE
jgi:hypothetical protein